MTCRVSTRAAHPVPWWSCVCVTAVCVTALLLVATPGLGVAFQHRQLECRPASDSTRRQDAWALTLDRSSAANDQPQCRKTNKLPHALYMLRGQGEENNINSDQTGHLVRALFGGGEDGGDGEEGCRDRRTPQLSCCPVARNHRWRGKQP